MNIYLYMNKGIVLIYTANCMHLQHYIVFPTSNPIQHLFEERELDQQSTEKID